jgi:excisionase family DNA binding protein
MARAKHKPEAASGTPRSTATKEPSSEVLTLGEAAAYLQFSEAEVLRLVDEQALPARRLGKEWRFLKTAIQDWLRTGPSPKPSKEAQLAAIGSWKDDPYLEEELKETYQRRSRPTTEDDS